MGALFAQKGSGKTPVLLLASFWDMSLSSRNKSCQQNLWTSWCLGSALLKRSSKLFHDALYLWTAFLLLLAITFFSDALLYPAWKAVFTGILFPIADIADDCDHANKSRRHYIWASSGRLPSFTCYCQRKAYFLFRWIAACQRIPCRRAGSVQGKPYEARGWAAENFHPTPADKACSETYSRTGQKMAMLLRVKGVHPS